MQSEERASSVRDRDVNEIVPSVIVNKIDRGKRGMLWRPTKIYGDFQIHNGCFCIKITVD